MDYLQHYYNLTSRARKTRPKRRKKKPFHGHHVIPKSMLPEEYHGDERNIVYLTPRSHFIAHKLLCKIFPNCNFLQRCLWLMANVNGHNVNAREYEKLRKLHSAYLSKRNKERIVSEEERKARSERVKKWIKENGNPNKGKKYSKKRRKEMSLIMKKWHEENENPFPKGSKHSEKTKRKISELQKKWHEENENPFKGKKHTEKTKRKIGAKSKGRFFSKETREKMSKASKGKKKSKQHRERIKSARLGAHIPDGVKGKISNTLKQTTPEQDAKIYELYDNGIGPKEIGERLNISYDIVRYRVYKNRKDKYE